MCRLTYRLYIVHCTSKCVCYRKPTGECLIDDIIVDNSVHCWQRFYANFINYKQLLYMAKYSLLCPILHVRFMLI